MPFIRRRPLLRAAAIGGGAYAFGKHRERMQAEQQEEAYAAGQQSMEAQPAAAPEPSSGGVTSDDLTRLQELAKLHEQGVLTDDEFSEQKALILGA